MTTEQTSPFTASYRVIGRPPQPSPVSDPTIAAVGCGDAGDDRVAEDRHPPDDLLYRVGEGVTRPARICIHERKREEPVYRPLRIFTQDAATSRLDGAVTQLDVPYEPLEPGPRGCLFEVDPRDYDTGVAYRAFDPDHPFSLMSAGRDPSPSDPMFHQQMVYAVCSSVYATFRHALGRHPTWGFDPPPSGDGDGPRYDRLRLHPHGGITENAYYDRERGEIRFGYFRTRDDDYVKSQVGAYVFTALSHDIIVHEVSHALVDGLRAHFDAPSNPDVLAFHEAFADLMAIFQRFTYQEVVRLAVRRSRGNIRAASLLTGIATEFGHAIARDAPLRTVVDTADPDSPPRRTYDPSLECHLLGSVLSSAVFEAFVTVFSRKVERYVRLATNGTGLLPPGEPSLDFQIVLAEEASQLASQFQVMCIRALDYCPPVDITFGEFLRAAVTADRDLIPSDPWGYREAWVDAFRRRGITMPNVRSLAEDALVWREPELDLGSIDELSFARLQFHGEPGNPMSETELRRQAAVFGQLVASPQNRAMFGLADPDDPALDGDMVDLPVVQSVRTARRVGPDRQFTFDLVAEVTQCRTVAPRDGQPGFCFLGGSTVIFDATGAVRFIVRKSVLNGQRVAAQRAFIADALGGRYWCVTGDRCAPRSMLLRMVHDEGRGAGGV